MGFKYIDAAISAQLPGKPTETLGRKAILVAICWYANNKSGLCWPSWNQLAARAQCSRKTAKSHALDLIDLGLVVVKGERSTPKGPVKLLWVNLNKLLQLAGQDEVEDAAEPDDSRAGNDSGDADSIFDDVKSAFPDPKATVGTFDQGSSDPTPRVDSTPVPGLDLPPTRVVATPKPGIDLELQPGIQTWKKKSY